MTFIWSYSIHDTVIHNTDVHLVHFQNQLHVYTCLSLDKLSGTRTAVGRECGNVYNFAYIETGKAIKGRNFRQWLHQNWSFGHLMQPVPKIWSKCQKRFSVYMFIQYLILFIDLLYFYIQICIWLFPFIPIVSLVVLCWLDLRLKPQY